MGIIKLNVALYCFTMSWAVSIKATGNSRSRPGMLVLTRVCSEKPSLPMHKSTSVLITVFADRATRLPVPALPAA